MAGDGVAIRAGGYREIAGKLMSDEKGAILLIARADQDGGFWEALRIPPERSLSEVASSQASRIVEGIVREDEPDLSTLAGAAMGSHLLFVYARTGDDLTYGGVPRVWSRLYGYTRPRLIRR